MASVHAVVTVGVRSFILRAVERFHAFRRCLFAWMEFCKVAGGGIGTLVDRIRQRELDGSFNRASLCLPLSAHPPMKYHMLLA